MPGSVEHPVILVANRKGGTGKTTVAVNLAAELVRTHGPTLLVDIDPQGHAGLGLGVIAKAGEPTVHDLFTGRSTRLEGAVRPTSIEGLDIVPADRSFAGDFTVREPRALAVALEPLRARYAAIVLDTAPISSAATRTFAGKCASSFSKPAGALRGRPTPPCCCAPPSDAGIQRGTGTGGSTA
ncbi:MAG: AAA family ATPase [Methylacidiphilales bacterium]|nr:AAA family ATPase [Candidatus Methylacidiphilales bacterium]